MNEKMTDADFEQRVLFDQLSNSRPCCMSDKGVAWHKVRFALCESSLSSLWAQSTAAYGQASFPFQYHVSCVLFCIPSTLKRDESDTECDVTLTDLIMTIYCRVRITIFL